MRIQRVAVHCTLNGIGIDMGLCHPSDTAFGKTGFFQANCVQKLFDERLGADVGDFRIGVVFEDFVADRLN